MISNTLNVDQLGPRKEIGPMWEQLKAAVHTIAVFEIGIHLVEAAVDGWALPLMAALVIGIYLGRLVKPRVNPRRANDSPKGKRRRR
jgi:hypothetical protein